MKGGNSMQSKISHKVMCHYYTIALIGFLSLGCKETITQTSMDTETNEDGILDNGGLEHAEEAKCILSKTGLTCSPSDGWYIIYRGQEYPLTEAPNIPSGSLIGLIYKRSSSIISAHLLYVGENFLQMFPENNSVTLDENTDRLSVFLALINYGEGNTFPIIEADYVSTIGVNIHESIDPDRSSISYSFENTKYRYAACIFETIGKKVFIAPRNSLMPSINWYEVLHGEYDFNIAEPSKQSISLDCFSQDSLILIGSYMKLSLIPWAFALKFEEIENAARRYPETMARLLLADAVESVTSVISSIAGVIDPTCVISAFAGSFLDYTQVLTEKILLVDDSDPSPENEFNSIAGNALDLAVDLHACAIQVICATSSAGICMILTKAVEILNILPTIADQFAGAIDTLTSSIKDEISVPLTSEGCNNICEVGKTCLTDRPKCGDFPEASAYGCAMTGIIDEECLCHTNDELVTVTYLGGGWPDDPEYIFPAPYWTRFEPRIEVSIPDNSSALGASCLIRYPLNPGILSDIYDCLPQGRYTLGGAEAICSGGMLRAILCCVAGSQCASLSTTEGAEACENGSGDFIFRRVFETSCPAN